MGYRYMAPPIVVVITDVQFHNTYVGFPHHTWAQARNELLARNFRVVSAVSTNSATVRSDMEAWALDTGAQVPKSYFGGTECLTGLGGTGVLQLGPLCPLVFEIGSNGTGLADALTEAVLAIGSTY